MKFLLVQCIIFYHQYNFINGSPIIGENVRGVTEREFPFVVPIVIQYERSSMPNKNRFCIGTVISNQKILTAEHCLLNIEIHRIRIYVGSHNIKIGIKYNVYWQLTFTNWATYENYPISFNFNDIAIIKLSTTLPNNITPVALSTLSNSQLYGLDVSLAGWSRNNYERIPTTMETSFVTVLTYRECKERVQRLQESGITIHEGMLCTATQPFTYLTSLNNYVSANVKAAKVSQKPITSFYGLDVSIAGWGIRLNGIVPSILETVTLNILNNNECKDRIMKLHRREINIGVNIFCTSAEPYALMSHGDSGDPIMYNNEIIGVSSGCFNELSFHPDKVNVHVHVAYYRKFILDIIKNF
ncbi:PREDICTED: trypsin-like [Ceratosolen solmsi marchali]|uniref:Trypsin-like n=1 Tax=Ceratosolen solmsi marchali TaxID=326594 RepID=A0AAJ7DYZ1_9HYME|nr:PREDICTED: trypsin-like [Ceratosolen solmsi marchali]